VSARERPLPSAPVRFALEAGFIVLVGVVAAVLDLRPLAIVVVMGIAWVVVALVERVAMAQRPARAAARPREEPAEAAEAEQPPVDADGVPEPEPRRRRRSAESRPASDPSTTGEWNLWELERRARDHAGKDSVPEEWAAMFMYLREYAKSDGRLPPQFDELVRESFPELTRAG
jgi:hypothetical protein